MLKLSPFLKCRTSVFNAFHHQLTIRILHYLINCVRLLSLSTCAIHGLCFHHWYTLTYFPFTAGKALNKAVCEQFQRANIIGIPCLSVLIVYPQWTAPGLSPFSSILPSGEPDDQKPVNSVSANGDGTKCHDGPSKEIWNWNRHEDPHPDSRFKASPRQLGDYPDFVYSALPNSIWNPEMTCLL